MKWFEKWIFNQARKLRNRQNSNDKLGLVSLPVPQPVEDSELESNDSLAFRLIPAAGGVIVSIRKYDRVKDRVYNTLHIITQDQDISSELGKIAALELYKL